MSSGVVTHPGCDAQWSGLKVEHCPACHMTFSSTRVGDAHRVGDHGVTDGENRRRCLTPDEFAALTDRHGSPRFVSRPNGYETPVWVRHDGRESYRGVPQTAPQDAGGAL